MPSSPNRIVLDTRSAAPSVRYLISAGGGDAIEIETTSPRGPTRQAFLSTIDQDGRATHGALLSPRQLRMLGYAALELANELEKAE